MDERQRQAWRALGLGPVWRLRDRAPAGHAAGALVDGSAADGGPAADTAAAAAIATDGLRGGAGVPTAEPGADGDFRAEAVRDDEDGTAPGARRAARIALLPWPALAEAVAGCGACGLCETRRRTVFGVGPVPAPWMLVGEAPGEQEDLTGEPFVGPAGRLLDAMLAAIGVRREHDAFIANVLKCRPPRNRDPSPEEVTRCEPYLLRQVELLQPRLIVVLGRFAAQTLLRTDASIASLRGRVHRYRVADRELPLVVTYHPAYLLRSLPDKSKAWADLRLARRLFDEAAD